MATPIGFDPSTINSTTTGSFYPGEIRDYAGKSYEFVKLTDAVNATNGMVAEAGSATDGTIVTVDRAGGSSLGRIPRGVFVSSVTAGRYGFILKRGLHAAVKDAAGGLTVVGRKVTTHATTDGDADVAAATLTRDINIFGEIRVASAAGVAAVYVSIF